MANCCCEPTSPKFSDAVLGLIGECFTRHWGIDYLKSDDSQALDRIRVALDQPDQQRRLCVRFGTTLFPVFQRAFVGAQIAGKHGSRKVQIPPDAQELLCRYGGGWSSPDCMCAQSDFAN